MAARIFAGSTPAGRARARSDEARGRGGLRCADSSDVGGLTTSHHATLGTAACFCWRGVGRAWACSTCLRWTRLFGEVDARRAAFAESAR